MNITSTSYVSKAVHNCNGANYIRYEIYSHQKSELSKELTNKKTEISALKSELVTKNSEISALKSENSEMKAKQPQLENLVNFAEFLYGEKEFADVKIVCDGKPFHCHKVVLSRSDVFKTMFKNKSLIEKQTEGVMKVDETDVNSDTMEQFLHYLYFQKVEDNKMINVDLMIVADKYNVKELLEFCTKYLESNLSDENALEVLVKAELVNQKNLIDAASKFIYKNIGRVNKTSAWEEMSKKNPALIVKLFSQMSVME